MNDSELTLTLLVPGHNEERHIGVMLDDLAQQHFVKRMGKRFDVIVVDDGSTDRMAEIAESKRSSFASLRVLKLNPNVGKGRALQRALAEATGDVIGFVDGDHTFDLSFIEPFYDAIAAGTEIAVGNRRAKNTVFHMSAPVIPYIHFRAFVGERFNDLVRAMTKLELLDTQCGFKFFRRDAARVAFSRVRVGGFVFDLEVLLTAMAAGYRIEPLPIGLTYKNPEPVSEVVTMSGSVWVAFTKVLFNYRAGYYQP